MLALWEVYVCDLSENGSSLKVCRYDVDRLYEIVLMSSRRDPRRLLLSF